MATRILDLPDAKYPCREVYSALVLDHSSDYDTMKVSILNAYELVLEAYRQKFRESKKGDNQIYVEFACDKEWLFYRYGCEQ